MPIPNIPASPTALQTRQSEVYSSDLDIITAADQGTGVLNGGAVTPSSAMTLAVAASMVASQGIAAAIAASTVTIATADATNPRIDLVVATSAGAYAVRAGTAAASPVMASLTSGDVALAQVDVAAGTTTITTGMIVDKRISIILPGGTSYITLPPGWDKGWAAAKAGQGSAIYSVNVIGDSTTEADNNATDVITKSWFWLVRAGLIARYAHAGDYWNPAYSAEWYTTKMGFGTWNGTPPYSAFTAGSVWNPTLFGQSVYWGAASPTMTFTAPYACTDLDVLVLNYSTSTWTYKVDAAAAVTVTPPSGNVVDPPFQRIAMLTSGASSAHVILYTGSASVEPMHCGTITYPVNAGRTRGLGFVHGAVTGLQLASYIVPNNGVNIYPSDPPLVLQGASAGSGTSQQVFPAKPSLMFINLGINDCQTLPNQINTAYSLDGYERALGRIIQACRRGNQDCSVVIISGSMPMDSPRGEVTSGNYLYNYNWQYYVERQQRAAQAYGAAHVNIHMKWGETGVARGFQTATDPHPTDAGYADIAASVLSIL